MSDPIEQLGRFRSEVEGEPMMTAAEIRRRGDRIRRRSTVLKAGVAAVALAAVVAPLSGIVGHRDHDSHVTDPTADGVGSRNVLADWLTVGDDGGRWARESSGPGDGQDAFNPCARQSLTGLGASSVYRRSWNNAGGHRPAGLDHLDEVVAQLGSDAAAQAAYQRIAGWITGCAPRISASSGSGYQVADDEQGTTEGASTRFLQSSWSVQAGPTARLMETGLVVSGDRIAVLTWLYDGQDFSVAPTILQQMLPAAASALTGATPPLGTQPDSRGTATGAGPAGRIPAGFPLDAGWDKRDAEGPDSILPPSRTRKVEELTACGTTLPWPDHADRMTAGFHNPEDGRDRTLTTYADADAAVAATQAIVDLFRACPSEPGQPDGYVHHRQVSRTSTSGDSWLISNYYTHDGAPAIGLTDIEVVRVGLAVLVMSHSNEGGKESIPADVRSLEQETAVPLAAMCVFTEAGC